MGISSANICDGCVVSAVVPDCCPLVEFAFPYAAMLVKRVNTRIKTVNNLDNFIFYTSVFISCGRSFFKPGYVHTERIFPTFVIKFITQGTVRFMEGDRQYDLSAGKCYIQTPDFNYSPNYVARCFKRRFRLFPGEYRVSFLSNGWDLAITSL
jgi:hypothetical protein